MMRIFQQKTTELEKQYDKKMDRRKLWFNIAVSLAVLSFVVGVTGALLFNAALIIIATITFFVAGGSFLYSSKNLEEVDQTIHEELTLLVSKWKMLYEDERVERDELKEIVEKHQIAIDYYKDEIACLKDNFDELKKHSPEE